MSQFRCMKAPSKSCDPAKLDYHTPWFASFKLDGIRMTVKEQQPMSTSYTPLPSRYARRFCRPEWEGLDGELIARDARPELIYKDSHSAVMTQNDNRPLIFYVFDWDRGAECTSYEERRPRTHDQLLNGHTDIRVLHQEQIYQESDLLAYESRAIDEGHEGLMVRRLWAPYKYGRSSEKEGYIFKLVRHERFEAEVLEVHERMHNANEKVQSNLGLTKRSTHQENKTGLGTMGSFTCRHLVSGVVFDVGTGEGLDLITRDQIWQNREKWPGKIVTIKSKPYGADKKPRQPILIWERDRRDM